MPYDDSSEEIEEETPDDEGNPFADDDTLDVEKGPTEDLGDMDTGSDPVAALAQAITEHGADDPAKLIEWLKDYGFELVPIGGEAISIGIGVGMDDMDEEMPEMPDSPFDIEGGRKAAAARAMRGQ